MKRVEDDAVIASQGERARARGCRAADAASKPLVDSPAKWSRNSSAFIVAAMQLGTAATQRDRTRLLAPSNSQFFHVELFSNSAFFSHYEWCNFD